MSQAPYNFAVKTIKGVETTFGDIGAAGKVTLVVNVASACGACAR